MPLRRLTLLGLSLLIVVSRLALGDTVYIDAARPNDAGDGRSWQTAKRTLLAGSALVASGDTALIRGSFQTTSSTRLDRFSLELKDRVTIRAAGPTRFIGGFAVPDAAWQRAGPSLYIAQVGSRIRGGVRQVAFDWNAPLRDEHRRLAVFSEPAPSRAACLARPGSFHYDDQSGELAVNSPQARPTGVYACLDRNNWFELSDGTGNTFDGAGQTTFELNVHGLPIDQSSGFYCVIMSGPGNRIAGFRAIYSSPWHCAGHVGANVRDCTIEDVRVEGFGNTGTANALVMFTAGNSATNMLGCRVADCTVQMHRMIGRNGAAITGGLLKPTGVPLIWGVDPWGTDAFYHHTGNPASRRVEDLVYERCTSIHYPDSPGGHFAGRDALHQPIRADELSSSAYSVRIVDSRVIDLGGSNRSIPASAAFVRCDFHAPRFSRTGSSGGLYNDFFLNAGRGGSDSVLLFESCTFRLQLSDALGDNVPGFCQIREWTEPNYTDVQRFNFLNCSMINLAPAVINSFAWFRWTSNRAIVASGLRVIGCVFSSLDTAATPGIVLSSEETPSFVVPGTSVVEFAGNWYHRIAPTGYSRVPAYSDAAGWAATIDRSQAAVFGVDPQWNDAYRSAEPLQGGRLASFTFQRSLAPELGINNATYDGRTGAWQFGASLTAPRPCTIDFDNRGESAGYIDLADLLSYFDAWGQANGTACP